MLRSDLAVVVLNWNNAPDTLDCLRTLSGGPTPVDTIVVDNGSTDDSADIIEASGLATTLLRNSHNAGYAGGNNVGLRAALDAGYAFVAVLNNDTLALTETFTRLLATCRSSRQPSAVSPRITYADRPDEIWFAGGLVDQGLPRHLQQHELGKELGHDGVVETMTLTGCCILAEAAVWKRVGLFDERYFLIFEDSDWSARCAQADVRMLVDHQSVLQHKVSRSFGSGTLKLLSTYFYVRNGLRYHWHYQRRWLPLFVFRYAVRPALAPGKLPRGSRRFTAFAVRDWLVARYGNASPSMWSLAARLSTTAAAGTGGNGVDDQ